MGTRSAIKERRPEAKTPPVDATVEREQPSCRHHWIIESPRGALSSGRCKVCGEERQFRNSANDYIWDDDTSSGASSGIGSLTGVRPTPKLAVDDDEMVAAGSGGDKSTLAL
jgi:hypothetical protein